MHIIQLLFGDCGKRVIRVDLLLQIGILGNEYRIKPGKAPMLLAISFFCSSMLIAIKLLL
jgi:hypothetical protein